MSQSCESPPRRNDMPSGASSKLSSFSAIASKTMSRCRSTTIDSLSSSLEQPLSSIASSPTRKSLTSPTIATRSQTASVALPKPLLRDSPFCNVPHPRSASKEVTKHQSRLVSSQLTTSFVKSRIPTPCPRFKSPVTKAKDIPQHKSISGPDLIMPTLPLPGMRPSRSRYSRSQQALDVCEDVEVLKQFTPRPRHNNNAIRGQRRHSDFLAGNEKQSWAIPSSFVNCRAIDVEEKPNHRGTSNHKYDNVDSPTLQKSDSFPAQCRTSQDIVVNQLLKVVGPPSPRRDIYGESISQEALGVQNPDFAGSRTMAKSSVPAASSSPTMSRDFRLKTLGKSSIYVKPNDNQYSRVTHSSVGSSPIFPPDQSSSSECLGVYHYQSTAFWTGRFISMTDRMKTEGFINTPSPSDERGEEKMIVLEGKRMTYVFTVLDESCRTLAARESLLRFKRAYATKFRKLQILNSCPSRTSTLSISTDDGINNQTGPSQMEEHSNCDRLKPLGVVLESESGDSGSFDLEATKGRRNSFIDRLMGKNKRGSVLGSNL